MGSQSVGHNFVTSVFPDRSVGKESACNARDLSSIPGSGRYPGQEIGYPLQRSSLVAQLVKNQPATQETWVWSLGWEDPLEKEKDASYNLCDIFPKIPFPTLTQGQRLSSIRKPGVHQHLLSNKKVNMKVFLTETPCAAQWRPGKVIYYPRKLRETD